MAEGPIIFLHALNGHMKLAVYVFSVFDECPPLPARDERGEGRGGGSANLTRQGSLLSPALSSLRGGEGEENSATLNTYHAASLLAAPLSVAAQAGPRSPSWVQSTLVAGWIVLLASGWSAGAAGLEWQTIAAGRVARLAVPTGGNPGFMLLSGRQTGIHF